LCVSFEFVNHDSRWGNTAQAIDQWWHSVASRKALDVLYRTMHPVSYRGIAMASKLPAIRLHFLLPSIHCCPLT
jgi:hypothetical protein